ncbi:MAG: hypothetical protein OEV28_09020, partial [Nitrospirota bacterium]|nr:hypothetical protein [Nitrospirota bacterium]
SSQYLSPKYGNWSLTCRQCHTPHNTKNIFLVKEQIKTPNSGYRNVDFRSADGFADYSFANKAELGTGPCETCHTKTSNGNGSPRYRNTGTGPGDGSHQNAPFTGKCIQCHDHKRGFSPVSPGGLTCGTCHPKQWTPMNGDTSTYHMYVQNSDATALVDGLGTEKKYPSKSQPSQETDHRRCLMCHADMEVFSRNVNPDATSIAYNLRASISVAPVAGDLSTHSNTDFRKDLSEGGICLSCHRKEQTKNNAKKKNDGTTKTPPWDVAKFGESAHNFTVDNSFKADSSSFKANCVKCHNDDLSKDYQKSEYKFGLHDTRNRSMLSNINSNLTYTETSYNSTEEHFCYQCHSKDSEGSSDYNPNGASSDAKDAYRVEPMKQMAIKIKNMFESGKKSFHPINGKSPYDSLNGLSSAAGKHKVDEWMSLPTNVQTANWNPASSRHVECTDCHNPHAASKEPRNLITWRPNQYHPAGSTFSGNQMVEGSFGGQVGGANKGVWGIEPTFGSSGGTIASKYAKLENSENIYQLCFKCHTSYAYGTSSKPHMPMSVTKLTNSGGEDNGAGSTWSWSSGPETDVSAEFNPNNYSFHPILRRGRNQPAPHLNRYWPYFNGGSGNGDGWNAIEWEATGKEMYNSGGSVKYDAAARTVTITSGRSFPTYYMQPGWRIQFGGDRPSSSRTWYEIKTVDSDRQVTLVSGPSSSMSGSDFVVSPGLGWAFVPPYGPWSTITCADCHSGSGSDDPRGPHGSDQPWLLREVDQNVLADANLNGVLGDSDDYINKGSWSSKRSKTFCYNCHRRDVYGVYAANDGVEPSITVDQNKHVTFSRMAPHPRHWKEYEPDANALGIWCMTCHGGIQRGGLHGSNRGKDSGWGGKTPGTPSGMRLRNGAAIGGSTLRADGGTCWTREYKDDISSCVMPGGDKDYTANYNYYGLD